MRKVLILDTTLRDGEQAPGYSMNQSEKVQMAKQLDRLGVDIIEAGLPVSSNEDYRATKAIAAAVQNAAVTAISRCVKADIQRTWEAIRKARHPRLHLFIATSEIHMEHKLNMTEEQVFETAAECVAYAKSLCNDVEFSAEDATRSDRAFLLRLFNRAIQEGATTVNIADTVGYATPTEIHELVSYLKSNLCDPSVKFSVHVHNDLGMGVANTLASIRAGADQVECTVNGIGERAGNVALEEIVMALHTRRDYYQCETNIDTKQIYRTCKLLTTMNGVGLAPNKPIVGVNAFAHESGIHQHGVLMSPQTYEIMKPEDIGIYRNQRVVLGKHSGKHAFADRIAELGYSMSEEAIVAAFERFKRLAERKKEITDKDMEALIGAGALAIRETYSLKSFVINSGPMISATAVVRLVRDGQEYEHVARGEGPIDASFKAIDRIVKMQAKLENWTMQAVTEGEDALGEAVCKITCNGHQVVGRGLSSDIVEASIRSYINAINKAVALEEQDQLLQEQEN